MVADDTNTASFANVSPTPSLPNRMVSVCAALTTTLTTMSAFLAVSAGVFAPRPPSATNRATGSSGNISVRCEDGGWLVTPTNASLGALDPARLSRLGADNRLLSGDAPTKEIPLHAALYETRSASRAIVHLHSTHSVALSMLPEIDPRAALPPMTPYYLMKCGATALVPYYRPGDPAVADAIRGLAGKYASVLLANHGPVEAGDPLEAAEITMEAMVETARLYLQLCGLNPRYLTTAHGKGLTKVIGQELPGKQV